MVVRIHGAFSTIHCHPGFVLLRLHEGLVSTNWECFERTNP